MSYSKSKRHRVVPGGAHTYAKGDDQFPTNAPSTIVKGKGCHVWDTAGRKFVEYGMGLRSVTLGHAHEGVNDAIFQAMKSGINFTRPAPIEAEAAERLIDLLPAADMVKFAKNGSDATTAAVRLARACTGRERVAVCADHPFFSVDDWFIGSTAMRAGVPRSIRDLTTSFRYNDMASLTQLFTRHPDTIACVVMEPEKYNEPDPGYLQGVRDLCNRHGALLIFDEIITGFRHAFPGMQTHFNVQPDLSAFGKALGNGFSIAALAGKREYMSRGGLDHDKERVFLLSTTYGAETHHLAAALKVIDIYETEDTIGTLDRQGKRLARGFNALCQSAGIDQHLGTIGKPCDLVFFTKDERGEPSQAFRTLFMQELVSRGIVAPSFVVSAAHTDADIDHTLDACSEAVGIYKRALEDGVHGHLRGPPVKPVYRSFN